MNTKNICKNLYILTFIVCIILTSCGKSDKKDSTDNSNKEIIGEDISVDTLSFTKTTDECTSTMLFTYEGDKLTSVGVTNEYANRTLAQDTYKTFSGDTVQYTNVNVDSKTLTYTLTEEGLKTYSSMSKEELQNSLVSDGFVID